MKNIAVFCGSSSGNETIFATQAAAVGKAIANRGYGLVYGGAHVGLMGIVADNALNEGGEVIGVIPAFLQQKELAHKNITQMHIVKTMHERKAMMNDLSDGFIALPGGYGTLEELFEMLTWAQLSLHKKPVGLLNVNGFYNSLISMSDEMIKKGFLKNEYHNLLIVEDDIARLLDKMDNYIPASNDKWFETK